MWDLTTTLLYKIIFTHVHCYSGYNWGLFRWKAETFSNYCKQALFSNTFVLRKSILIQSTTHVIRRMAYIPGFVALSKQDAMTTVAELTNNTHFVRATSCSTHNTTFIHVADLITTYCLDAGIPAQSDTRHHHSQVNRYGTVRTTDGIRHRDAWRRKENNPITFSTFRNRLYAVLVSTFPVHHASHTETGWTKR